MAKVFNEDAPKPTDTQIDDDKKQDKSIFFDSVGKVNIDGESVTKLREASMI